MKRLLLISMIAAMLPLSLVAQDDDLYFVPTKKSVEKVTDNYGIPTDVYYSGSNRSIDEYNRRTKSHYEVIGADSTLNDTISFTAEKGVYPDSISDEDFELTKKMSRFEDYRLSDYEAFWAGYSAGRYDWAWHSPWYYIRYGWYDPWYWNNPYYYGWYSPWYYGWNSPWYYGYYRPWHYGWGYPYYYGGPIYSGRVSTHQGRRTTYENNNRSFGRTNNNSRTTYDNNRSFGSDRTSTSTSSFGSSMPSSSGGGFSGGGGGGGARTSSGGRSFGGRK